MWPLFESKLRFSVLFSIEKAAISIAFLTESVFPDKWWTECNSGIEVEYPQNVNIVSTVHKLTNISPVHHGY